MAASMARSVAGRPAVIGKLTPGSSTAFFIGTTGRFRVSDIRDLSWRPGSIALWDNRCAQHNPVNDYHGYQTATEVPPGIKDITGTPITGLGNYNAAVTVAAAALRRPDRSP